jgi:penicillin-binding protein 1A
VRLRVALAESLNLVSVRVLQALGLDYAIDFVSHFGFPKDRLPRDMTLALGSATLTPWEVVRGYATFANGGFLIDPYFIESIQDASGKEIFHADPKRACPACDAPPPMPGDEGTGPQAVAAVPAAAPQPLVPEADRAPRVLTPQIDYLINNMMHDVVVRGTGAAVRSLGRDDLAGKTGTSNEFFDAWFNGFNSALVASAWIGYDQPTTLGHGEVGAKAALPVWMDFMRVALKGVPVELQARPPDVVPVSINPANGKLVPDGTPDAVFDVVQSDHVPPPDDGKSDVEQQQPATDIY